MWNGNLHHPTQHTKIRHPLYKPFTYGKNRHAQDRVIYSILGQSAPSHKLQSRLIQLSQAMSNFSKAKIRGE